MRTVPRSCGFRASGANSPPCSFEKCVFCAWAGSARELFGALLREVFFCTVSVVVRFPLSRCELPSMFLRERFFSVLVSFSCDFRPSGTHSRHISPEGVFFGTAFVVVRVLPFRCGLPGVFLRKTCFRTVFVSRILPSKYKLLGVFFREVYFSYCFRFRAGFALPVRTSWCVFRDMFFRLLPFPYRFRDCLA